MMMRGWISAALSAETRSSCRMHPFFCCARARLYSCALASKYNRSKGIPSPAIMKSDGLYRLSTCVKLQA